MDWFWDKGIWVASVFHVVLLCLIHLDGFEFDTVD